VLCVVDEFVTHHQTLVFLNDFLTLKKKVPKRKSKTRLTIGTDFLLSTQYISARKKMKFFGIILAATALAAPSTAVLMTQNLTHRLTFDFEVVSIVTKFKANVNFSCGPEVKSDLLTFTTSGEDVLDFNPSLIVTNAMKGGPSLRMDTTTLNETIDNLDIQLHLKTSCPVNLFDLEGENQLVHSKFPTDFAEFSAKGRAPVEKNIGPNTPTEVIRKVEFRSSFSSIAILWIELVHSKFPTDFAEFSAKGRAPIEKNIGPNTHTED